MASDNVLLEAFEILFLMGLDTFTAVDAEAGMLPASSIRARSCGRKPSSTKKAMMRLRNKSSNGLMVVDQAVAGDAEAEAEAEAEVEVVRGLPDPRSQAR